MNILSVEKISKSYGGKTLFSELSFGIATGEKVGLIGVNGIGKSTLFKLLIGQEKPDTGQITTASQARIGYLSQNPLLHDDATVLEEAIRGNSPIMKLIREYEETRQRAEHDPENEMLHQKLIALSQKMEENNAWQMESDAKTILTKLGITDFNATIATLSGGSRKRVALAAALINPVDLLILDEPTNHIDNNAIDWLEQVLLQRSGALLMITHDRYFLDRVVNRTFELSQGKLYGYEGNYSMFLEKKAEREEMEASSAAKRENLFRRELAWIRRGAKARSTKQQARIDRFEQLQSQMAGEDEAKSIEITAGSSRLGKKIIILEQLGKSFEGQTIIQDLNYIFAKNDRVGIIGSNGTGKTTLLNMIAGKIQPDRGRVEIGPTVKMGFFTQENTAMDENLRVIEYIKEQAEFIPTADGGAISASQMLERFLFPPGAQWSPIAKLSGGEKRRLYLLRILMGAPNVLLLDEPTNDLDIQTLSILEDYLEDFPGVVIAVSHDRYFLDRVAEKIIALQGHGHVTYTVGNYSYYLEEQQRINPPQRSEETAKKQSTAKKESGSERKGRPGKLSYMEQREYDGIEAVIAEFEQALEKVKKEIEQSGSDYLLLQELTRKQEEFEDKLTQLVERWAYLSELVTE